MDPSGSVQKQIEQETRVKIIFPSAKEETLVALEGKSAESIRKASERISKILGEAVQSPMLDYSHFISLPLAIHPALVEKLNNFQRSILRASASNVDSDKDESLSEGSMEEIDEAANPSVSVKLPVKEENSVIVKMDNKGSQPEFSIDKSIFIKPKMFHLTVLMLKLWNKDRISQASEVLQSISSQVNEALENRPISIQLKGLTCMKGSPARARVVYAPVLEIGAAGNSGSIEIQSSFNANSRRWIGCSPVAETMLCCGVASCLRTVEPTLTHGFMPSFPDLIIV
ncbi:hypothetical protein CFC21_037651 [Triticum aestivum]|uniref:Uncharacterized protein n=2 Tax=Triticum aestivum TaxID=4565 RepID=A0A3B6ENZ4_WHEAT|nr:hypothetical protein CFC21_037651 [Triticum aestivum]